MTLIEVANKVVNEKTCHVVRPRKGCPGQWDAKEYFTGSHRGWTALDPFTASAIAAVGNAINEANRAKLNSLPVVKAASICFKLCK